MRSMSARTCSSLSKLTLARDRRPSRSMYTLSVPLTMISVTVSSAIRSSSGPSPNTVLIRPSTKSRNTAGRKRLPRISRREPPAGGPDLVARPLPGLSTAMSATLSRGTSSPTAIRARTRAPLPRAHRLAVRGRLPPREPIPEETFPHLLTMRPWPRRPRDGSRDPCVCAACPATPRLPWAPSRCGREEPAPPHLQDEKPRAAARREHPQCLCTKGSKLLPGSAPCPRRAAPPLRDRRRQLRYMGPIQRTGTRRWT